MAKKLLKVGNRVLVKTIETPIKSPKSPKTIAKVRHIRRWSSIETKIEILRFCSASTKRTNMYNCLGLCPTPVHTQIQDLLTQELITLESHKRRGKKPTHITHNCMLLTTTLGMRCVQAWDNLKLMLGED